MNGKSRTILTLATAVIASAALAGCGSGSDSGTNSNQPPKPSKLSSQDQQQLLDRTSSMSKELQTVVTQTVKCVKKVAVKAGPDPSTELRGCLSPVLDKAQAAYQDSSNWINGLASRVSGSCQQELQSFASASSAVGTNIKDSTSALIGGDTPTFQANISKLSTTGTELQKAASGVGQSCAS